MDAADTSHTVRAIRPYRAVAFDIDGLLFNTEELYRDITREMLSRRGLQPRPGLLDAMRGKPNIIALGVMHRMVWTGRHAGNALSGDRRTLRTPAGKGTGPDARGPVLTQSPRPCGSPQSRGLERATVVHP